MEILKMWSEIRPKTKEEWKHFGKIALEAIGLFTVCGALLYFGCLFS